jgi:hypothetical protein
LIRNTIVEKEEGNISCVANVKGMAKTFSTFFSCGCSNFGTRSLINSVTSSIIDLVENFNGFKAST